MRADGVSACWLFASDRFCVDQQTQGQDSTDELGIEGGTRRHTHGHPAPFLRLPKTHTHVQSPGLLGLNYNRGQKILLRLRPHDSPGSFMDMESILGCVASVLCIGWLLCAHAFTILRAVFPVPTPSHTHRRIPTPNILTVHPMFFPTPSHTQHKPHTLQNRTMLHELVHNEIGEHSDKFYTRLEGVCVCRMCVYASFHVDRDQTGAGQRPLFHVGTSIHLDTLNSPFHHTGQLTAECEQLMMTGLNALTSRHVPYSGKAFRTKRGSDVGVCI